MCCEGQDSQNVDPVCVCAGEGVGWLWTINRRLPNISYGLNTMFQHCRQWHLGCTQYLLLWFDVLVLCAHSDPCCCHLGSQQPGQVSHLRKQVIGESTVLFVNICFRNHVL